MILKKRLKKILWRGILRFLPVALLASAADAALLWGIRSFMDILQGEAAFSLTLWLSLMVVLSALRFAFFAWKMNISEKWLFGAGSLVMAWFLHTLRSLSPRVFHTPEGESEVEAAYESTIVLQGNGGVFFQGPVVGTLVKTFGMAGLIGGEEFVLGLAGQHKLFGAGHAVV